MTRYQYIRISADQVPSGIRWDTPARNQGQHCEVSYGCWPKNRIDEGVEGDPYMRVIDEDRAVRYFVVATRPRWGRLATRTELESDR